jgi:hypothetical protein
MTKINILYIAVYRALECLEQECQDDDLSAFLDKANPYVFVDRKSADPAIYDEFKLWCKEQDKRKTFEVVKDYLNNKTKFGEIFSLITEEEWNDLVKMVEEEESQDLKLT